MCFCGLSLYQGSIQEFSISEISIKDSILTLDGIKFSFAFYLIEKRFKKFVVWSLASELGSWIGTQKCHCRF